MTPFIHTQKQKQLLMKVTLMMYLNQYTTIISNIKKKIEKGLGYINDSVIDHNINISKYSTLASNCFIKLPK